MSIRRVCLDAMPRTVVLGLFTLLALTAPLLLASPAGATTVLRLDDADQAVESDLVILGTVVEQRTRVADDGLPYTDSTVRIEQVLRNPSAAKPSAGDLVVVRQLGGPVGEDGAQLVVPGDAQLVPGELAVYFLSERTADDGVVYLTALGQSKLAVVAVNANGELVLARDLAGLTFYDPSAADPLYIQHEVELLTLNELARRFEEAAR